MKRKNLRGKILNQKLNQILRHFLFSEKCSLCGQKAEEGNLCFACRKKIEKNKNLRKRKNVYFLFNYKGDIRQLIIDYKLEGKKNTAFYLSSLMAQEIKDIIREEKIDVVIPVPISRERYLERGFNQVALLLDLIGIDYKNIEREKNTIPMHSLNDKNLRRINIKSAFKINFITKDKNILLVDDIITTGTTVDEISKVLETAGKPKNIFVFALSAAHTFFENV